jgi:hypothetical protein
LVFSPVGAHSADPYTLQADVTPIGAGSCVWPHASASGPGTIPADTLGGNQTLILWNYTRMTQRFGIGPADALKTDLQDLASLTQSRLVAVDQSASVQAAYAAWDANCWDSERANAVSSEIQTQFIDDSYGSVLIVGSDEIIPFFRVPDEVTIGKESDYLNTNQSGTNFDPNSALTWSLQQNFILTNDFYTDFDPVPWRGRELYVPDTAIGRLVETPAEIATSIANHLASSNVTVNSCVVTGYDFLSDSASAIESVIGSWNTPFADLVNSTWTANDLQTELNLSAPDLVSLNAHFTHWGLQPASLSEGAGLFTAAEITNAQNQVAYSMGCHGGLNVPDLAIADPLKETNDFAQVFAQNGAAAWVANTGYGFGVDDAIAASELLMLYFTQELGSQPTMPIGQALINAKQRYAGSATSGGFSVFDEKAMIEATLYGLPMHTVSVLNPTPIGGLDPTILPLPDWIGLNVLRVERATLELSPFENITTYGVYYSLLEETQAWPGRPIQPSGAFTLSAINGDEPRGQLLISAEYEDHGNFDPVVAMMLTQDSMPEPAFSAQGWFPSKLWAINTFGDQDRSTIVAGQFNPQTEVERLYTDMVFETYYYSPDGSESDSDFEPPVIWGLSAEEDSLGNPNFIASVDGAERVLVTCAVPGTGNFGSLISLDLRNDGSEDPSIWTYSQDGLTGPTECAGATEYFLQAMDGAGNVSVASKEGFHLIGAVQPDAVKSVNEERTISFLLEFDSGEEDSGFVTVEDGTLADVDFDGVGMIVEEESTCNDELIGTLDGECQITITSSVPGLTTLTVSFKNLLNPDQTDSFTYVTEWWAGSVEITNSVEFGPFTTADQNVCFTLVGDSLNDQQCLLHDTENGTRTFEWTSLPEGTYVLSQSLDPGAPYASFTPITLVVDSGHRDHKLTHFTALLDGTLEIEKRHTSGGLWTGSDPDMVFEIFECDADQGCSFLQELVSTVTIPISGNPASIDLPEGTYLVREIVPDGYLVEENDQVLNLIAGQTYKVTFENRLNAADEGCSPGYWKNHLNQWPSSFQPEDSFDATFGVLYNTNLTILEALNSNGGGKRKLARHGVAALLNASSGMDYPYSAQTVFNMVSTILDGNGEPEASLLAAANSLGCPLP